MHENWFYSSLSGLIYHKRVAFRYSAGEDTGFPEGGGVKTLTSTPPRDVIPQEIDKHPPGHSQAPPPLDIVRVTSSALRKINSTPIGMSRWGGDQPCHAHSA